MKKVAVLLSGGVDSSVALSLLKEQGYDIEAFYLKIWLEDDSGVDYECPWHEDIAYVTDICKKYEVLLHVVPMQKQYYNAIVAYTIAQAKQGNTPNPDVLCNTYIKFGAFLDYIGSAFDFVATGHYAQRVEKNNFVLLGVSPDPIKDQTYFLSYLSQSQLRRVLFPIGHYTKVEVRMIAEHKKLPTAGRKDSQGICFLGKIKFKDFLQYHLGIVSGNFVNVQNGNIVGKHDGAWFYTIGQRRGIGLAGGPWYVVDKDINTHTVFIAQQNANYGDNKTFYVVDYKWSEGVDPVNGVYKVKVRHGPQFHDATVSFLNNKQIEVKLHIPDQAIASGQFAVFYKSELCVGAGIIKAVQFSNL